MEKMEHYVSLKPETLKLSCKGSDAAFNKAASFTLQGVWKLNPISFVAKGQKRDDREAPTTNRFGLCYKRRGK
ncbi:hypothetical protein AHAS_Ahas03G0029200 [Arachis hypogaea]